MNILLKYALSKRKLKIQGDHIVERKREILLYRVLFL